MKVLFVLFLAVASTCAVDLKWGTRFVDIRPVVPILDPESRIVNGASAKAGQFPYQVGLSLRANAQTSYWCGGSLIAPTWVLTAAHCTDGISSITAYLGSTTRLAGTAVTVAEIIIHSGWNAKTLANDISLLRIPAVSMSANINVIAMPAVANSYSTYVGDVATASGWGLTADNGNIANALQYADLTISTNNVCTNAYGSTYVKDSNICIATTNKISTCNGDSGGPLVLKSSGLLIGATSYGSTAGCAKGYPIAFTRVTSYRTWIKEKTGV